MSQKLNTHHYDGKLMTRFNDLKKSLLESEVMTLDQTKKELIDNLKANRVKLKISPAEMAKILNMINQLTQNQPRNYDSRNEIHVHELLPLVWHIVKKYDNSGQQIFYRQILEIYKGPCAQGRTTRLLQCT
jgi:hypothetical protein